MIPLSMALWVFLFVLTISCVLMWGAGAETPHDTIHDTWHNEQGLVSAETLCEVMEQFICMKAQFQKAREELRWEPEAWSAWETRASRWHTTLLAIAGGAFLLVICCCCRL